MKNMLRTGAAIAVAAGAMIAVPAHAQADNEATANAKAEILSALTLEVETGTLLDFGKITVTDTSADPSLNTYDAVLSDNLGSPEITCADAELICSGTVNMPQFNISGGTASKPVVISLPSAAITLSETGGDTMSVSGWTSTEELNALVQDTDPVTGDPLFNPDNSPVLVRSGDATTAAPGMVLDGSGEGSFIVGATLAVRGDQSVGVYTGQFDVSVNYE
ncbi:DUF4402 domain-containing protein [Parerythrobacter jejuensis]|uniref:DUF4402 domain-containing protein n=1 Tax=Parerythrobacter jejuensis TaxID=795812 RepID=A0A845AR05_9SPHN|nr:DUF4402 domain-containing protein [Parerythrobacter jejuensis]MXP30936.1 DUF4402 domain-containing protein [Parerythrobacter jejuensis]MXP33696.1 DUF4402 domain-containing protein [Parerythrobacter jejuensis]